MIRDRSSRRAALCAAHQHPLHCDRPLGHPPTKCPTCFTRQPWWDLTILLSLLLALLWLAFFGLPLLAG